VRRLSVDLEDGLFTRFSVACVKRGLRKSEVVRRLIERWLESVGEV